jgi:two-component sensor histidine kinase
VKPPDYTFDEKRLTALRAFKILDTSPEQGFDDIVNLAALICDVPVALVSFVANNRQWFKARVGFEPCETDLDSSVCAHALVEPDLLVIEDLSIDPRTRENPLVVGGPCIRFYAGAPLRTVAGDAVGSLCVIDGKPRARGLTAPQAEALRSLARQVMSQLELRCALVQRDDLLDASYHSETRRNGLLSIGDTLRQLTTIPEATKACGQIVAQTLGVIRSGFGRIEGNGEFINIEPDWSADGFSSVAGRHRLADYGNFGKALTNAQQVVVDDATTDLRTASSATELLGLGIRSMANMPVRNRAGIIAVLFAHSDNPRDWPMEDLEFLRNAGDRVEASVARFDAEAAQHVLNLELSHRMKNTMAIVQAIGKQTLRSVPNQAPVEAFNARLEALATAHEVLLQQNWVAADMNQVVSKVLGTVQKAERFKVEGPPVKLGPRATLTLSLLLHELATNALKYGAWSTPAGRVSVTWQVADDDLVLNWRETGGPGVSDPKVRGFGSRLIAMGLIGTGGVAIRYLPCGLEGEFKAPLSQVQQT